VCVRVCVCAFVYTHKHMRAHKQNHTRIHKHTPGFWGSIAIPLTLCCSVLQCVAVCCSVLQCVVVCCSVLKCVLQCVAVCRVAVCITQCSSLID